MKLADKHGKGNQFDAWECEAQSFRCLDTIQMWHTYVEENQVTVSVHGFLNGFQTVFGFAANSEASRGLDRLSDGTAHGGVIVHNENSWPAPNTHVEEDSSDPLVCPCS